MLHKQKKLQVNTLLCDKYRHFMNLKKILVRFEEFFTKMFCFRMKIYLRLILKQFYSIRHHPLFPVAPDIHRGRF